MLLEVRGKILVRLLEPFLGKLSAPRFIFDGVEAVPFTETVRLVLAGVDTHFPNFLLADGADLWVGGKVVGTAGVAPATSWV